MRRSPCPRCARRGGVPIAYGFPGGDMEERAERGEIVLGGCVMDRGSPGVSCWFCGHSWGGPLPAWWPPEDTAVMGPAEHERARDDLTERFEHARVVPDAFEFGGIEAATTAAEAYRRHRAGGRTGPPRVPSDCVRLAETLDAAEAMSRVLDPEHDRWSEPFGFQTPEEVFDDYLRARGDAPDRAFVDVLHLEYDFILSYRLDGDRSTALVRRGGGSELPAVDGSWVRELDRMTTTVFDDGSGHGWARFVWSYLSLPPIATQLDVARAGIRLVALGVLRERLLLLLDGHIPGDAWTDEIPNPGIAPFHLGRLAAVEFPGFDDGYDPDLPGDGTDATETDVVRELARRECRRLGAVLPDALEAPNLIAATWASQYPCARFPLTAETRDEALNGDPCREVEAVSAWIAAGMVL